MGVNGGVLIEVWGFFVTSSKNHREHREDREHRGSPLITPHSPHHTSPHRGGLKHINYG